MYVYRFLNKENEIIYIGKTKELNKRLSNHSHLSKECYSEIKYIEYIKLLNYDEMSIYERYYINKFNPKYNIQSKNNSEFRFELPNIKWVKWADIKIEKYNLSNNKVIVINFPDFNVISRNDFFKLIEISKIINKDSSNFNRKIFSNHLGFKDEKSFDKIISKLIKQNFIIKNKDKITINSEYIKIVYEV